MSKPQDGAEPAKGRDEVARRLDQLERENNRLRLQIEHLVGPDNPCFDRAAFQRVFRFYLLVLMLPFELLFVPMMILGLVPNLMSKVPTLGAVPLLSFAGMGSSHPGIGLGLIAFGGLGVGVIAVGGLGVGIIALGGGSVGLIAFGGGAAGLIAIGGGAIGYIAIGGSAAGRYALGGQSAYGKAVFTVRRQDPEAVAFFVRWLPRFKAAITTPLPVVPLDQESKPNA